MRLIVEGDAKEIAALVLELQERQGAVSAEKMADEIMLNLQVQLDRASQVSAK